MALDYETVKSWPIPDQRQTYTRRDTILYNLGVGCGVIESPEKALLEFVWEQRLKSLPTMVTVLGEGAEWLRDPKSTITWTNMVHGEQSVEWHATIPPEGEVLARSEVESIHDKGADRGALLVVRRRLEDVSTGMPLATLRIGIFLRDDGGFGGEDRGPHERRTSPKGLADCVVSLATRPEQALIYRLSGDYYDLHVDPDFGKAIGYDRPILHGLATYGIVCRAIMAETCSNDPTRLLRLDGRFTAPVYPGDVVETHIWRLGNGEIRFCAKVGTLIVIDNGLAQIVE